jgi:hypothetical protein
LKKGAIARSAMGDLRGADAQMGGQKEKAARYARESPSIPFFEGGGTAAKGEERRLRLAAAAV